MPKRIGPEARIISLFTALPDESKRIVLDVIRTQTAAPRKPSTKKAATASEQPDKDIKCGVCGHIASYWEHDRSYGKSHDFEAPKSVARAGRRSSRKEAHTLSVPSTASEADDAIAAGASGD